VTKAELISPGAARAGPQSPKGTFGIWRCRRPRAAAPASASHGDELAQSTQTRPSGFSKAAPRSVPAFPCFAFTKQPLVVYGSRPPPAFRALLTRHSERPVTKWRRRRSSIRTDRGSLSPIAVIRSSTLASAFCSSSGSFSRIELVQPTRSCRSQFLDRMTAWPRDLCLSVTTASSPDRQGLMYGGGMAVRASPLTTHCLFSDERTTNN